MSIVGREMSKYMERMGAENERLRQENTMLRARLDAVRARCEANNWMGTARLCGGESELTTSHTHACDATRASS